MQQLWLKVGAQNSGPPFTKTSYRKISRTIEADKLNVTMIVSLWDLTGISAADVDGKGNAIYIYLDFQI